jgi:hypothetical protein
MKRRRKKPDHINQEDWDPVASPSLRDEVLATLRLVSEEKLHA